MMRRWLPIIATVIVAVSACSSGSAGPSVSEGKKIANETRRPVAETYWRLYRSIGEAAFTSKADGSFARCTDGKHKLVRYTVRTVLDAPGSKEDKGETERQLVAALAERFASAGWNLSQGLHRSATRGGIKVELLPPEFSGETATTAFQVQSKCVDLGAAADGLLDSYGSKTDIYESSNKDASPVPTTFPEPGI